MLPELQTRFDALEERKQMLLEELHGLEGTQLTFHPAPDAWSLLQVADHLARVEAAVVQEIRHRRSKPHARKHFRDRIGAGIVRLIFALGVRVKMPIPQIAPGNDLPVEQTEQRWKETRQVLRQLMDEVTPATRERPAMRHPVGGPLTAAETLRFVTRHFDHHLRQIRRIRSSPAFPR